jgi:uncharacterized protein DUF3192
MRMLSLLVLAIMLPGCASRGGQLTLAELASTNQSNVARLSVGMSRSDVITLMGNSAASTHDGIVNNPWTAETFLGKDGARYETLYYITRKNQPFTPVRKSLATGIVLKEDKVIGWGENALREYRPPAR